MAQQAHKIIVIGYTNLDEDHFADGRIESRVGGGGYFSAQSATKELSARDVLFVTMIGKDFDEQFIENLNQTGISRSEKYNTSKSVQKYLNIHEPSQRELTLFDGTSQLLNQEALHPSFLEQNVWVHISTMPPLQQEPFIHTVRALNPRATISIDSDMCLYTDEHLPGIKKNFLQADVVFANRLESQMIQDIAIQLRHLIVKEDKDGAKVLNFGQVVAQQKAPKVRVKNSTGAGDTFAGAYIAQKIRSQDEDTSLKYAVEKASKFISSMS